MKKAILEICHVSKSFRHQSILSDGNMTVYEGELLYLCGKNGSGKSTIFKIIAAELASSARMAKRTGAKVVTCCCKEGTPLERYSDVSIIGYAETITSNKTITVISRIPLYIITRTIVEYLTL